MSKISIVREAAEKASRAESDRTAYVLRNAERFAAGIIIVMGFELLDVKTLLESPSPWVKISCYLSLAVLSISLFFAFRGMWVKGYADYPRGNKLWDNLKPENVSEDAAQEALVQMLLQTREQNARLNDAKVNSLFWCGWLLFIGFLLAASSQLLDALVDTLT
ncbi:MAG: hypothetical protein ACLP2Y_09555 [Limisphaerales bacterium]